MNWCNILSTNLEKSFFFCFTKNVQWILNYRSRMLANVFKQLSVALMKFLNSFWWICIHFWQHLIILWTNGLLWNELQNFKKKIDKMMKYQKPWWIAIRMSHTLSLVLGTELTATGCHLMGNWWRSLVGGKSPARKLCALIKHLSVALLITFNSFGL